MRILFLSLCCLFFTTAAFAQSVQVRSGQHDGFTRLIVDLPARIELQIEQDSSQAQLTFPGQSLRFDTTRVFDRIARERVVDVAAGPDASTLVVKFGCRCEMSSFWHGKSLLVLDVRDSGAEPPILSVPDDELTEVEETPKRARLTLPEASNSLAASMANSQFVVAPLDNAEQTKPIEKPALNQEAFNEEVISEARDRLIKQIGRAASQGLLAPKSALNPKKKSDAPSDEAPTEQIDHQQNADPRSNVNLRAQSSVDRDFLTSLHKSANVSLGQTCLDDQRVDVGSWGTDQSFAQQVGQLRMALMGEFDQLNPGAAIKLAQLYLHYGFGAEATLTLALIEEGSQDTAILYSMAAIMQNGHATANSALSGQLTCESPAALWSILSYESLPVDVPIEVDAALRTFDALPGHLRKHLGPTLSRRFLEAGHHEAADKALRIVNRSENTLTSHSQLVEAEINLSEGHQSEATATMNEVIETNSEPSAEALINVIDATIKSDQGVSFDHAVLAGAYAQQNRGGALEIDLLRVYLTGLSASGAFEQSYEEFGRLSTNLPEHIREDVSSEMLRQLTQRADDVTFLKHVLINHSEDPKTYAPRVANGAATRLLNVGFAPQARPFLDGDVSGELGRERQMLRAQIALAESRPRQAEAELVNLEDAAADQLRAQARSQVGDHRAAASLYSSSGERDQSLRQTWLAEDWKQLMETQTGVVADVAALAALGGGANDDAGSEPKAERVLAYNRELIQQSLAARDTIEALLQENPSP